MLPQKSPFAFIRKQLNGFSRREPVDFNELWVGGGVRLAIARRICKIEMDRLLLHIPVALHRFPRNCTEVLNQLDIVQACLLVNLALGSLFERLTLFNMAFGQYPGFGCSWMVC